MHYSDIYLKPQYSKLSSRKEAEISVTLGDRTFESPLIPANMKCSIDFKLAEWMSTHNYFYILHRFYNYDEIFKWIETHQHLKTISISIGVKPIDYDFIRKIAKANLRVDYVTIDIAHFDSFLGKCMLQWITKECEWQKNLRPFVIAGNIATIDAARRAKRWGANAVKVGIGPGFVCSTKDNTGFTIPMFTCVKDIFKFKLNIPIIADGGIRGYGDIAKAIVAGADMVMAGSMFTACIDSPAEVITEDKEYVISDNTKTKVGIPTTKYKKYYGSASEYNKGHNNNIEGVLKIIPCNQLTYKELLNITKQNLQSSCSYGGVKFVSDLRGKKIWDKING